MIYLASSSPRRAELLRQIGVEFEGLSVDIDESKLGHESAAEYVCRMARCKAQKAHEQIRGSPDQYPVLAADTIITLDGGIIGKPADVDQCHSILQQLSAKQHLVLTAVALATAADTSVRLSVNRVSFRRISAAEIESYCATAEPRDKAGAYAIQGRAAIFIEHLEGSYSSVMGLPLFETAELLESVNIVLFKS
jgi:septum formation protein